MDMFLRAAGAVMIALVLGIALENKSKDIGTVLSIAVCCMIFTVGMDYLEPVAALLKQLESICDAGHGWLGVLLKAVGIGMVAEIASLVCSDAGNSSMGKAIEILAGVVILWLSIPIISALMDLLKEILGEL